MRRRVCLGLLGAFAGLASVGCGVQPSPWGSGSNEQEDRAEIRALLSAQQAAWNRGDVRHFMDGYWNSPELSFSSSRGTTRGWQEVLDRYQKNYPDKEAMGQLDFSELEVRLLGADAALILGRWELHRPTGTLGGVFTLVVRRFPEGWRITHDHTSSVPQ